MRPLLRRTALLALGSAAAFVAVASRTRVATAAPSPQEASRAAYAVETARIRAHFDSVLAELRAPVARELTPSQRAARQARIATLQAYRDRGVFPHNHEFFDGWMPYFVDHRGVLCAVAWLLESSGRRDIVDRVAAADNNVRVPELAGDAEFRAWLDASGLTLDEAARIQVPYVGQPWEPDAAATNRTNNTVAAIAGGLGAASIVWSARAKPGSHRMLRSALGLGAGVAGIAIASSRNDARGGALAVGVTTGVIGTGAVLMGVRALMLGHAPQSPPTNSTAASSNSVSIAPAMLANGDRMAPGLTVNVRF